MAPLVEKQAKRVVVTRNGRITTLIVVGGTSNHTALVISSLNKDGNPATVERIEL